MSGSWGAASAQSSSAPAVPPRPSVDANGVELASGTIVLSRSDIVIGQPGAGGLSYAQGGGVVDPYSATVYYEGNDSTRDTYQVSIGGKTETFYKPITPLNAPYYSAEGGNSMFAEDATGWTHTSANGTTTRLGKGMRAGNAATPILSQTLPDGEVRTFHYVAVDVCSSDEICSVLNHWYRLQSITNNRGYQIKIVYASSAVNTTILNSALTNWLKVTSATGINMAVDWCDPLANGCGSLTQAWPTVSYTDIPGTINSDAEFRVTDALGGTTGYSNTGLSLKVRWQGSSTYNVTYNYDFWGPGGRITSVVRNGKTWSYARTDDATSTTVVVTDPASRTSTYVFAKSTRALTSYTNTAGELTTYANDGLGRPDTITFPGGEKTHYVYDDRGNIKETWKMPYPAGSPNLVWQANFDATCTSPKKCNKPNYTIDPAGGRTDFTYDSAHGGVTSVMLPAPTSGAPRPTTTYRYTPYAAYYKGSSSGALIAGSNIYYLTRVFACRETAGCAEGSSDELRTEIGYGSDGVANNRLPGSQTERNGTGTLVATTTMDYDAVGNRVYVDGPLSGTVDRTYTAYDALRRVTGTVGPNPNDAGRPNLAIRTNYNSTTGLIESVDTGTMPNQSNWASFVPSQSVVYGYDTERRVTKTSHAAGGTTYSVGQVMFDDLGRPVCKTVRMNPAAFASVPQSACEYSALDPAYGPDRITKLTYDSADRTNGVISGLNQTNEITVQSMSYLPGGKLDWMADGKGNKTTYSYDPYGRLYRLYYPHPTNTGTSSTTDYEEYGYDLNSQVTSTRQRSGAVILTPRDALGRITVRDLPATTYDDVYYTYDNQGRQRSALFDNTPGEGSVQTYDGLGRLESRAVYGQTLAYQYDLAGRRQRLTYPDGFYVTYQYTDANDLKSITDSSGMVLATYGYDALGSRTSLTRPNGTSTNYVPDPIARLQQITQDLSGSTYDLTASFQYNPAGQIRTKTVNNDAAYTWTAPGSPFSSAVASPVDGQNQLSSFNGTAVTDDANGNVTTGISNVTYTFNVLGQLIQGVGPSGLTSMVGLAYEPSGKLMAINTLSSFNFYIYDGEDLVYDYSAVTGAVARRFVHGPGTDEPIVMYTGPGTNNNRTWLHADERGSIVAVSNQAGATSSSVRYSVDGDAGSLVSPFGFTGQLYIPELQLYYYKARMYSPKTGRFLQPDLIGYQDGMNLYAYAHGDPVNRVDPSGLDDQYWYTTVLDNFLQTQNIEEVRVRGTRDTCDFMCMIAQSSLERLLANLNNGALVATLVPDEGRGGATAPSLINSPMSDALREEVCRFVEQYGYGTATFEIGRGWGAVAKLTFSNSGIELFMGGGVGIGGNAWSVGGGAKAGGSTGAAAGIRTFVDASVAVGPVALQGGVSAGTDGWEAQGGLGRGEGAAIVTGVGVNINLINADVPSACKQ